MKKRICFDMDGTIANLYEVENWLNYIINEQTKPYREAKPMVNMRTLGKELNRLQNNGYEIEIISWTAKNGKKEYNEKVAEAKKKWLKKHLGSVHFDNIHIIEYGTPKQMFGEGILFDDEEPNRNAWNGIAYNEQNIIEILKAI